MVVNIIDAIINIVHSGVYDLQESYVRSNRANSMGDALEKYIIDSFSGLINEFDENIRMNKIGEVFSYLGNDSNPPDAMLRGGAGIETKKIESRGSTLQLNSSHPKSKLYVTDPRINRHAVSAEEWDIKDFIYAIGWVQQKKLKELALIDASVYCADTSIYSDTFEAIKLGISSIPNVDFSPTKELGRVNKVDPLGITNLRIRGMWLLENPFNVFKYIYIPEENKSFNLFGLVSEEKYNSFSNTDELEKLSKEKQSLDIADVQVKNPNNPAQLILCKKITFYF